MRLPGTLNVLDDTKRGRGRELQFAEMVEFHDERIYDLEDFPLPTKRTPPRTNGDARYRGSEDGRDVLERARDALRSIPSNDYDVYLRVCMALKSAFGDVGFGACRDWAMTSIKFDDGEFRRKWNSISPDGGITIRTLFAMARDHGWREAHDDRVNSATNGETSFDREAPERETKKQKRQGAGARPTQADVLIEIATGPNIALFHTPDGTAYADIRVDGHRETWAVQSPGFKRRLRRAYFERTRGAPNNDALAMALAIIEARAVFDGPERIVHLRVAQEVTPNGDRIYLDLCAPDWRAVEIDRDGWRIVAEPPVRFRRTRGMLQIPDPVGSESGELMKQHLIKLRNLLNIDEKDENGWVLVVSWVLSVLRGQGPYPILVLCGEQGTGKSLLAFMLRFLVDPNTAALRSLPRDTRDLYVAAINNQVLVFDNLSSISAEVADALCRLSTGGGFSTRSLYTDTDEVIFDGQRPIALTGISDVATRSDLADRSLLIPLTVIAADKRRPEAEIRAEFERARPDILGAVLDVVAHGLLNLPTTRLNRHPRMADYAVWMRACETAIWQTGMHLTAYELNRAESSDVVLDFDPVATAIRNFMADKKEYQGTSTALLAELNAGVLDHVRRANAWPPSPNALSGRLTRLAPALRQVGISFDRTRGGKAGDRFLRLTKSESSP